jgi:propanol-preferring alcohol dehydrogenase
MKAAVLPSPMKPIEIQELPEPEPKGKQVVVKVEASGVCHTDVHIWEGHYGPIDLTKRGVSFPLVMGHEPAGTVERVGEDTTAFKAGDRVLVYPWMGDGVCEQCRVGNEHLCADGRPLGVFQAGGFAEYLLVPHERLLIRVQKGNLDFLAPMACAGLTAYSALKKAEIGPDETLAVIGVGGLGHLAVELASKLYHPTIIAVDNRDEPLEKAKELGADYTVNSSKENVAERINEASRGKRVDKVVDFVNTSETSLLGFNMTRKGGTFVMVGLAGDYPKFALPTIPLKAMRIIGNFVGSYKELTELVHLVQKGVIQPYVTKRSLADINEALQSLRHGRALGRIILTP